MSIFDKQLYELSRAEAIEILEAFLEAEREKFRDFAIGNLTLDYTQVSVAQALKYVAKTVFWMTPLPDSEHNIWFARLGYYFGESLCRAADHLYWSVGEAGFAFENHPVIAGFRNGMEAPVITICKNGILVAAEKDTALGRIDAAVDGWFRDAVA